MRVAVEFIVLGEPAPQGSKTFVPTARGPRARESNERALRSWRHDVAAAAQRAMADAYDEGAIDGDGGPLIGPLELRALFVFARPKSHYGTGRNSTTLKANAPAYVAKKPDVDKLVRAIGDAITGIIVRDDAQLVVVHAEKHYGQPCAALTFTELEP